MAAVDTVYTLGLVAERLGEDADWLWHVSCEMHPEDGCISILGRNDEHTVAFTDFGIKNLIELVRIHKDDPSLLASRTLDSSASSDRPRRQPSIRPQGYDRTLTHPATPVEQQVVVHAVPPGNLRH